MNFYPLVAAGISAVAFAFLMLFQRTLYASALCLLMVLMQGAFMYFLLGAQLLGLVQILVYAGAVMILIVVAVMVAPMHLPSLWASWHLPRWLVIAALALLFLDMGILLYRYSGTSIFVAVSPILERDMAAALFEGFALMTEAVGLLILLASLAILQET